MGRLGLSSVYLLVNVLPFLSTSETSNRFIALKGSPETRLTCSVLFHKEIIQLLNQALDTCILCGTDTSQRGKQNIVLVDVVALCSLAN
jgi:hypothetical protein